MMFSHPDNTDLTHADSRDHGYLPERAPKPSKRPKPPKPLKLEVYEEGGGLPYWVDYLLVGIVVALFVGVGVGHLLRT